jgi:sodium/potassium/calcium exchanger 6
MGSFLIYSSTSILQLTVSNPCEGSYCRALVALSFALSPLWLGLYLMNSFDVNVWEWKIFGVYVSLTIFIGLVILRFAPGGDGTMSPIIAVRLFWLVIGFELPEHLSRDVKH